MPPPAVCDVPPTPASSFSAFVSPTRLSEAQGRCLSSCVPLCHPLSLCWLFLGCEGLGELSWTLARPAQKGKEFSMFLQLGAPRPLEALNPLPPPGPWF